MLEPADSEVIVAKPKAFHEISARQRFQPVLDHQQHELLRVLTDYDFAEKIACGLKGCRTPHNHGYLVETKDGLETNIGNQCGRSHFGDHVFDHARQAFLVKRDRRNALSRVEELKAQAASIRAKVEDLKARRFGIKWAKAVRAELEVELGRGVQSQLRQMHKSGRREVFDVKERTDEEIKDAQVANPGRSYESLRFEQVLIGEVAALDWIDFDFQQRLVFGVLQPLDELLNTDVSHLQTRAIKKLTKPLEALDAAFLAAEEALDSLLRFL